MRTILIAVAVALALVAVFIWRSCDSGQAPETALVEEAPPVVEETEPAATANLDGMVDVGGHRLHARTFGFGEPAVVIEPGIGDTGAIWAVSVDTLARESLVVLYSRAGYGRSDPGPMPRSADRVAGELAAMLDNAPVEPPYILVGHSLGAINALVYASEHAHLLDGLVLLDPPPLEFIRGNRFPRLREDADLMTAAFRRDAAAARAAGNEREAIRLETVASEHEQMFSSGWRLMASVQSLGDLPLVVVASGVPNPSFGEDAEAFQSFWRDSSERLTGLSTRGRFIYAENSTHDIPGDAPGVIVEAVRWCRQAWEVPYAPDWYEGDK
jgi:pimeloyl-ACP methyl ester carboxylesterase